MESYKRRTVLNSMITAGLVGITSSGVISIGTARVNAQIQQEDTAPDPEDYEDILDAMEGDGSEDNPYIITDVEELQAVAGDLEAFYELGNNIDASETTEWNPQDHFTERVGSPVPNEAGEQFTLSYTPLAEIQQATDGVEEDPVEVTIINAEEGIIELQEESVGRIIIDYTTTEEKATGFTPIGNPSGDNSEEFSGDMNGNGHIIENIFIDRATENFVGLFADASSTRVNTIEEITLQNVEIRGRNFVGGLAGSGSNIVRNLQVSGQVTGRNAIGGLIGISSAGNITSTSSEAQVHGKYTVGGLIGVHTLDMLEKSSAIGEVTGSRVGGLVGSNQQNATIKDCYSSSSVVVEYTDSMGQIGGGLVGQNGLLNGGGGLIGTSYASGGITIAESPIDSQSIGGVVGQLGGERFADGEAILQDSYWDTITSEQSDAVGLVEEGDGTAELRGEVRGLETEEMQGEAAEDNMSTLNFGEIWEIVTDPDDYPTLHQRSGEEGPPPVVGNSAPRDLNGDGFYRDVNGDGEFTIGDVQTFFQNRNSDAVQENPEFFNFDESEPAEVTIGDVQALFQDFRDQ